MKRRNGRRESEPYPSTILRRSRRMISLPVPPRPMMSVGPTGLSLTGFEGRLACRMESRFIAFPLCRYAPHQQDRAGDQPPDGEEDGHPREPGPIEADVEHDVERHENPGQG